MPPAGFQLDDGVYYNKYMDGQKIKMSNPLSDDIVTYLMEQKLPSLKWQKMLLHFLLGRLSHIWKARHKMGVKVIIFLSIFSLLVYLSMKRIWSRIDSEK